MRLPAGKIVVLVAVLCALCIGTASVWISREQPRKFDGSVEKLSLGIYRSTLSGLLLIAEDQGFFVQKGLDVTTNHYEYGLLAIKDLLAGNIDIASATDSVVAWQILAGADLKILAAVNDGDFIRMVARTDKGIRQWSDLKGKRVGLTMGTISELFLDRALTFNNLSREDIELVHVDSPAIVAAIKKGEVDAIVVWSPLDDEAELGLGASAVSWSVQYGQKYYWLLVCKSELIEKRLHIIERLVAALAQSENLVASNQAEAQRIIVQQANLEQSFLDRTWYKYNLKLSLDQQMVMAMEDAARWRIFRGRISNTRVPNFLDVIYIGGLRAVRPEAISIIH